MTQTAPVSHWRDQPLGMGTHCDKDFVPLLHDFSVDLRDLIKLARMHESFQKSNFLMAVAVLFIAGKFRKYRKA